MTRHSLINLAAVLLIVIAVVMIALAVQLNALPPGLTGIGFILIALVFLKIR